MKNVQQSLFGSARITLDECIDLTIQSINTYGPLHKHWAIAWSGGKDSTALLTLIVQLIASGQIKGPKTLTVLYADTEQNHVGTIYQAANFYYEGQTTVGTKLGFIINGRKVHSRTIGKRGVPQTLEAVRKFFDRNATMHTNKGKHKYIYPLTKDMVPVCKQRHQPFPKRNQDSEKPITKP